MRLSRLRGSAGGRTVPLRLRHKGAHPPMTLEKTGALPRLADRSPQITGSEIAASLVPPSQFEHASFDSYRPDHDYPSQSEAVSTLKLFAKSWEPQRPAGLFSRS